MIYNNIVIIIIFKVLIYPCYAFTVNILVKCIVKSNMYYNIRYYVYCTDFNEANI